MILSYQTTIDGPQKLGQTCPQFADSGTLLTPNNLAAPTGVQVGKHTVTTGYKFSGGSIGLSGWLQSDVTAQINTTPLNFGVINILVGGTTVYEARMLGSMAYKTAVSGDEMVINGQLQNQMFNFQDGITIPSGTTFLVRVTPNLKIPIVWCFEGYSQGNNQIARTVTSATTSNQTILSYTPVSDWTLQSFAISADTSAQVAGRMNLAINGQVVLEVGDVGLEESAPTVMYNNTGYGMGGLFIPLDDIEFQQKDVIELLANPWCENNAKFQLMVAGTETAYSGGGGGNTYSRGRVVNATA